MDKRIILAIVVLGVCLLAASVMNHGNLMLTALSIMCFGVALRMRIQLAKSSNVSISVSSMDQLRRDMRTMMGYVNVLNKPSNNVSK